MASRLVNPGRPSGAIGSQTGVSTGPAGTAGGASAGRAHSAVARALHQGAGEPHHVSPGGLQQLGDGKPDPARRAGDERELPGEGGGGRVAHPGPRLYTSRRNSSRVFASCSSAPRSALVTVLEFCFSTPRIIMRSEEHTSELQSRVELVCRLLLEKKNRPCPRRSFR